MKRKKLKTAQGKEERGVYERKSEYPPTQRQITQKRKSKTEKEKRECRTCPAGKNGNRTGKSYWTDVEGGKLAPCTIKEKHIS